MTMPLVELRLIAPAAGVDLLSDALLEVDALAVTVEDADARSEERRVGKECRRLCRSRWSPYH
jgi:hypothetical protein